MHVRINCTFLSKTAYQRVPHQSLHRGGVGYNWRFSTNSSL